MESLKGELAQSKSIAESAPKKSAQSNGLSSDFDYVKEHNEINSKQSVITN